MFISQGNTLVENPFMDNTLKLNKMFLFETNHGYHDVPIRTFSLNATHAIVTDLNNLIMDLDTPNFNINHNISEVELAKNVPDVIKIDNAVHSISTIDNGWNEKRYRFILEVIKTTSMHTEYYYIQGYSQYQDSSFSGLIDPELRFYINTITKVLRTFNVKTGQYIASVADSWTIIPEQEPDGLGVQSEHCLIRPCDVLDEARRENNYNHISYVGKLDRVNTIKTDNNNPLSHFTDTINSVSSSKNNSNVIDKIDSVLKRSRNLVSPKVNIKNDFIRALSRVSGRIDPEYFTLSDLNDMGANLNDIMTIVKRNDTINPLNSNSVLNPTPHNITATLIANVLPSLMWKNLITDIQFVANNYTGLDFLQIQNLNSIILQGDVNIMFNSMVTSIKDILLPQVSSNGNIIYNINVNCSLTGDVIIDISLGGSMEERYILPIFANNRWSPMITTEITKQRVVNDYTTFIQNVL